MTDLLIGGVVCALVLGFLQVRRVRNRRWAKHEQYPELSTALGLSVRSDRFLVDARVMRFEGTRHGRAIELEVGAGAQGVYVRMQFPFEHAVDLGVRVSVEQDDNPLTRVMRLREMEVGHEAFDSQFILLARSADRLQEVLNEPIRAALAGLRGQVRDLRLDESGLALLVTTALAKEELYSVIEEGARVTQLIFDRAEELAEARRQQQESLDQGGLDLPVGSPEPARTMVEGLP